MRTAVAITAAWALGLALLASSSTTPAAAGARVCMDRVEMLAVLKDRHGERPVAMGVSNDGELIEIVVGDGGTWTIVKTEPHGSSCVLAAGEDWRQKAPEREGPGA